MRRIPNPAAALSRTLTDKDACLALVSAMVGALYFSTSATGGASLLVMERAFCPWFRAELAKSLGTRR
jgi:hypothetical protein